MISLVNKTFFVTGLGSGIGYETGKLIKSLGGNLTGTIENEDQKKDILPLTEDIFLLNLNDSEKLQSAIQAAAKKYQGLDGLVGAAGIIKLKTFDATTSQELDQTLDVNLKANFKLAQFANSSLKSGASLIFISSQIGLVGHDNAAAYAASKAGLLGMSKSLAIEYGKKNIKINCISPGFIKSEMTDKIADNFKKSLQEKISLDRFGEPEDVANAVVFLCSRLSDYITGETIHVNGGMYFSWHYNINIY